MVQQYQFVIFGISDYCTREQQKNNRNKVYWLSGGSPTVQLLFIWKGPVDTHTALYTIYYIHINPNESNHVPTLKHSLLKSQLPLELQHNNLPPCTSAGKKVHFQKCFGVMDELFEAWKIVFFCGWVVTEGILIVRLLFFWQKDGRRWSEWVANRVGVICKVFPRGVGLPRRRHPSF